MASSKPEPEFDIAGLKIALEQAWESNREREQVIKHLQEKIVWVRQLSLHEGIECSALALSGISEGTNRRDAAEQLRALKEKELPMPERAHAKDKKGKILGRLPNRYTTQNNYRASNIRDSQSEPAAWMHCHDMHGNIPNLGRLHKDDIADGWTEYPLHDHPTLTTLQEPVGEVDECDQGDNGECSRAECRANNYCCVGTALAHQPVTAGWEKAARDLLDELDTCLWLPSDAIDAMNALNAALHAEAESSYPSKQRRVTE